MHNAQGQIATTTQSPTVTKSEPVPNVIKQQHEEDVNGNMPEVEQNNSGKRSTTLYAFSNTCTSKDIPESVPVAEAPPPPPPPPPAPVENSSSARVIWGYEAGLLSRSSFLTKKHTNI